MKATVFYNIFSRAKWKCRGIDLAVKNNQKWKRIMWVIYYKILFDDKALKILKDC